MLQRTRVTLDREANEARASPLLSRDATDYALDDGWSIVPLRCADALETRGRSRIVAYLTVPVGCHRVNYLGDLMLEMVTRVDEFVIEHDGPLSMNADFALMYRPPQPETEIRITINPRDVCLDYGHKYVLTDEPRHIMTRQKFTCVLDGMQWRRPLATRDVELLMPPENFDDFTAVNLVSPTRTPRLWKREPDSDNDDQPLVKAARDE